MFVHRWLNLNKSWRGWRFIIWHTVHHTSSSPSFPPHSWAKCRLNKQHAETKRYRIIHVFIQGKDLSQRNLATSHKNNPGWVKRKEIKFLPSSEFDVKCSASTNWDDYWATAKMNKTPGGIQRNCSHQLGSRHANIFVWSHQAPKSSDQEWVSESSLPRGAQIIGDCASWRRM